MLKVIGVAVTLSLMSFVPTASAQTSAPTNKITIETKEGALKLSDILQACPEIGQTTCSKVVNKAIVGKIVDINGVKYEVRYFSFEDTKNLLPKETNFSDYVEKNKIGTMPSTVMIPLPGIHFESFDFRRVKLEDGVYFSMALRRVE